MGGRPSCQSAETKSWSRRTALFSASAFSSDSTTDTLVQAPSSASVPPAGILSAPGFCPAPCTPFSGSTLPQYSSTVGTPGWAMRISVIPLPSSCRSAWMK